jgi:hypothetical protein
MKTERNKHLIINYIFIICVIILFLNDHFFKYAFSNQITGKLSDIAGIIIIPLILTYIFPKIKTHSVWISALLFIFWKSPYSESIIKFYNNFALIPITRVVDYSDILVIAFLPTAYYLIKNINSFRFMTVNKIHPSFILFPASFILMATSPPPSFYYTFSRGNFRCYKCHFTVNKTQDEIVEILKKSDILFDTIRPMNKMVYERVTGFANDNIHFYKINRMIIGNDTLRNLDFSMQNKKDDKTVIYFNGMNLNRTISSNQMDKTIKKYYKSIVIKKISGPLKNQK